MTWPPGSRCARDGASPAPAKLCLGIVARLHSSRGIREPCGAVGGLTGIRHPPAPSSQSNGTFHDDEGRRRGSCLPFHSQSESSCLMLLGNQKLSGAGEPCVGPQQKVGSSFQSLEPSGQAGQGIPCVSKAAL